MMSFSIFRTSLTSYAIISTNPRSEVLLQQLWKFPSSTQRHKTSANVGIFSYAFELSDSAHVQSRRYVFETVRDKWAKRNVYKRGQRAHSTQTRATATADRGSPAVPYTTLVLFGAAGLISTASSFHSKIQRRWVATVLVPGLDPKWFCFVSVVVMLNRVSLSDVESFRTSVRVPGLRCRQCISPFVRLSVSVVMIPSDWWC